MSFLKKYHDWLAGGSRSAEIYKQWVVNVGFIVLVIVGFEQAPKILDYLAGVPQRMERARQANLEALNRERVIDSARSEVQRVEFEACQARANAQQWSSWQLKKCIADIKKRGE